MGKHKVVWGCIVLAAVLSLPTNSRGASEKSAGELLAS